MTTTVDDAWAAGLFEGEGHTGSKANRVGGPHVYPRMVLQTTDLDVLQRFQRIVGVGQIVTRKTTGLGKRAKAEWKPLYRWEASSLVAVATLFERFRPYLGARRTEQFLAALGGAYRDYR